MIMALFKYKKDISFVESQNDSYFLFPSNNNVLKVYSSFRFFLLPILFILSFNLSSQVVINETSTSNVSVLQDEDGEFVNWIELYNTTTVPVDISGYGLSDSASQPFKWTFPSITINPQSHIVVYASGKDRKFYVDHWETAIYSDDLWRYFEGLSEPPADWNTLTFDESTWLEGKGGIGFGDGDDSTVVADPLISVYLRKTFTVPDASKISSAILNVDYDDGFVAYLNGVEIARSNIGGYPPAYNETSFPEESHEAQLYLGGSPEIFFVDEQTIQSLIVTGANVLSIQVHNIDSTSSDISSNVFLTFGITDNSSFFGPTPFWYVIPSSMLHTNFDIDGFTQQLILTDAGGITADLFSVQSLQKNHSTGRSPDGAVNICLFDTPSPYSTNNFSTCYTQYSSIPSFSPPPGMYPTAQTVTITSPPPGGIIRYTTDGSIPTIASPVYTTPIILNNTTALQARVFEIAALPGPVLSRTYLINFVSTLPIITVTADSLDLFDWNSGIYVMGPNADTSALPFENANFWRFQNREVPVYMEYYEKDGSKQLAQNAGLRIHGNWSKIYQQKGLRLTARDAYGEKYFEYPLFPDKPDIKKFRNFNLRNNSDGSTMVRDFLQQNAMLKSNADMMVSQPCVVILNGQYWGMYTMQEKVDRHYLKNNFPLVNKDSINLLRYEGDALDGDNTDFYNMVDFITNNDMTSSAQYNIAKNWLDIENICDYVAAETYYGNMDWGFGGNNIKFWNSTSPKTKWRYVLWDLDGGIYDSQYNLLGEILDSTINTNHAAMLRSLMNNTGFKYYFVNRYADLINTTWKPENFSKLLYKMRDVIAPEIPRHLEKWYAYDSINCIPLSWTTYNPSLGLCYYMDTNTWYDGVNSLDSFIIQRPSFARQYIQDAFSLSNQVDVTLDVQPAGAGKIKISTITPETLPWTGVYFDGVPVTISVMANPGYSFKYWQSNLLVSSPDSNASMTLNISANDQFTAYFEKLNDYFEVFPNPFNNQFTITFELPADKQVSIIIYNVLGQKVAEPVSDGSFQEEGIHKITLDANMLRLENGVYFIEFRSKDLKKSVKLIRARG